MRSKLSELAIVFLKLGCFAFGGPAAHIAMMEEEVVNKKRWMDRQHFLDLIGVTNLIPGPNSTEMTMHCGHERAGILGLFVAGTCFIFPAVLITGILAWLYSMYGKLPNVEPFIMGIKPAVLSIIASAILKLGKKAIKGWELFILGLLALGGSLVGLNEIYLLLLTGIIGMVYFGGKSNFNFTPKSVIPFFIVPISGVAVMKLTSLKVFWTFLKVGSVLYGGGYVLFAYLDAELVSTGWLSRHQLMEAVAVGQFTPGPVLSTATFIGFQLTGFWGAIAATLGIFLPSFLFVLILNPLVPKLRNSKLFGFFLDSVNVAAVAIMLGVLFEMTKITVVEWKSLVITIISLIVVFVFKKVNSMLIVASGALLGYFLNFI